MKPLTIEELKSLEVGDWVWITVLKGKINGGTEFYLRKFGNSEGKFLSYQIGISTLYYSDYGTKWLAFKNKEMAECKGEIGELPRIRPIVFEDGNGVTMYELAYFNKYDMVQTKMYRDDQLHEAERRLAELKGE